eukprot:14555487-Ditylum_brightwellii.AAC.1
MENTYESAELRNSFDPISAEMKDKKDIDNHDISLCFISTTIRNDDKDNAIDALPLPQLNDSNISPTLQPSQSHEFIQDPSKQLRLQKINGTYTIIFAVA